MKVYLLSSSGGSYSDAYYEVYGVFATPEAAIKASMHPEGAWTCSTGLLTKRGKYNKAIYYWPSEAELAELYRFAAFPRDLTLCSLSNVNHPHHYGHADFYVEPWEVQDE